MASFDGVKMVDMKRPKESLKPQTIGKISPDPYSFEHRVSLDADAMDKLGMDKLPQVGDEYHLFAKGKVHEVSSNESGSGKSKRVGIQITHMHIRPHDTDSAFEAVNRGVKDADGD